MKDTLKIEELRNRLFFATESYEGYKLTQNKKSVIKDGETGMFLIELPPRIFAKGIYNTYIAKLIVLESKDNAIYKDDVAIKVLLTKTDYDMLTNTLKVDIGDKVIAEGNTYKSKTGIVVKGRKWKKIESTEKKKKKVEEKGISLE